jgi:hypothetical protein
MPYLFALPTTSYTALSPSLTSSTHPSLPLTATSHRSVLRTVLKNHKRLPPTSQTSNLPTVLSAIQTYLPYLFALDAGLCGSKVAGEEIDVVLVKELEFEWRATLSAGAKVAGYEAKRTKVKSLESEIGFVLLTLAEVYALMARGELRLLVDSKSEMLGAEARTKVIATAMKYLVEANGVLNYLLARTQQQGAAAAAAVLADPVPDTSLPVLHALAELTMAEATLIAVLKDDPYPALVAESKSKTSKDWMFKSPSIPKVRAHLYARLCLAAAEHAARAQGMLGKAPKGDKGVDESLRKYADDLRRTARGKAVRFFAIDKESEGKIGEGLAYLRGAKSELGFAGSDEDNGKASTFSKLKKDWREKREDKKIEKDSEWGADAGRFEEGRVVDMLEEKWKKTNDTVRATFMATETDSTAIAYSLTELSRLAFKSSPPLGLC